MPRKPKTAAAETPQRKFDDEQLGQARDALYSISQSKIGAIASYVNWKPERLTEAEIVDLVSMRVAITAYEARLRQIADAADAR